MMKKVLLACSCALAATIISTCSSPSLLGASRSGCTPTELFRLERLPSPLLAADVGDTLADGEALAVGLLNIRSGFGPNDERGSASVDARLRQIAKALVAAGPPDLIGLNEVDFRSRRTSFVDQAAFIAQELARSGHRYSVVRGPAWVRDTPGREVEYGNALLVRHPIVRARSCLFSDLSECDASPVIDNLPRVSLAAPWSWLSHEPRGVVYADFRWRGRVVRAIVTHLDPFSAQARETQAAQVIAGLVPSEGSVLLLGDMNSVPTQLTRDRQWFSADRTHDILTAGRLFDLRAEMGGENPGQWGSWATYPSGEPQWALDGLFASADLATTDLRVFARGLSDHLGLLGKLVPVADPAVLTARYTRHALRQRQRFERLARCDLPEAGEAASFFSWLRGISGITERDEAASVNDSQ